jgi:FtsH-binding integral membrane protein
VRVIILYFIYEGTITMSQYSSSITKIVTQAIYKSFGWMSLGLMLTSCIAYAMAHSIYMRYLFSSPILFFAIVLAQFGSVIGLTYFKDRISYPAMTSLFLMYSALCGVTLSSIFLIYDLSSILGVFFITAGMFLFMFAYGLLTKHNLKMVGMCAMFLLFGIIILGFINFFMKSTQLDYVLSFFGVIVFSILIAYDTQKLRSDLAEMAYDIREQDKMAVFGALTMYLNFINLFLNLLRLLGKKNDR